MKKLMFISLLVVIPFCEAADPDQSWYQAVQDIPDWQQQRDLALNNNQIQAIPDNLIAPNLRYLALNNNQIQAIPDNLIAPNLRALILNFNLIQDISDNLTLPNLEELFLDNNHIYYVNPQIFNQFPRLRYLYLDQNPLTQENVNELRAAAQQADRRIHIIADDIGDQYAYAGSMKPAKR